VTIEAEDVNAARTAAFQRLGKKWAFIYTEDDFDRSYHPLGELARWSSDLDFCSTCKGDINPSCNWHGVAASNARQDAYWRRVGGHD
jgi:hypothetical protein